MKNNNNVATLIAAAHAKSDQKWRDDVATLSNLAKVAEYQATYMPVCELLAPILRNNAAALDIIAPTDPISLIEDPPLYYDRGAIFYSVRADKRNADPSMHGSRLKHRLNQQLKAYGYAYGQTLSLAYLQLLHMLHVVAIRDLGYEYILLVGRMDDPTTRQYVEHQQMRRRQPEDRNMI